MKFPSASLAALLLPTLIIGQAEPLHESPAITLVEDGQRCGNHSAVGAVCGNGLCCSIHTGKCGTGDSCGASICLRQYSTGCMYQGMINAELLGDKKSRRQETVNDSSADEDFSLPEVLSSDPGEQVVEGPIAEEPSTEEPSIEVPGLEEPGTEQPIIEEPSIEEPSIEEPSIEDPTAEGPDFEPGPFPDLDELEALPRRKMGSIPYGQVISSCTVPGTLALTFDDGPWVYTPDLLDLLARYRARATFFVCGGNMAPDQLTGHGHPSLLRRMISSGHQIGTHTWAHPHMTGLDWSGASRQILLNEQAFVGVLGAIPTYFRPPYLEYGQDTLDVMDELGYHVITLDVDTRDWEGDYDAARQNFLSALGSGGRDSKMVLAHDIHKETVTDFAEWMIVTAQERGYQLVTVGECLGDSVDNWYRNPYDGGSWRSEPQDSQSAPGNDSAPGNESFQAPSLKNIRDVVPAPLAAKRNVSPRQFGGAWISTFPWWAAAGTGTYSSAGGKAQAHGCMAGLFVMAVVFFVCV